jgi:hypothetical protein
MDAFSGLTKTVEYSKRNDSKNQGFVLWRQDPKVIKYVDNSEDF